MFKFNNVELEHLAIHKLVKKDVLLDIPEDELLLSAGELKISDDFVKETLMRYFLTGFKSDEFYHFEDPSDVTENDVKLIVKSIFDNPNSLYDKSVELAQRLYESSNNANIKGGEFYCTYMSKCMFNNEEVDAIGFFKSESKDVFLKIYPDNNDFDVQAVEGININKLDKGCVIFNSPTTDGYKAIVIDKTSAGSEVAMFWKKDFLNLTQMQDDFYHTSNYLDLCKNFCSDVFTADNDVPRQDQVMMLNKSIEYFDTNPEFDQEEFQNKVLNGDAGVIDAFDNYKEDYSERTEYVVPDKFGVSEAAVKDNKKHFKSILKLDKKFHVYVHGGENFIDKGFDEEKRMNFYKLYFHNES